jgi:hypothetical protein
VARADNPPVKVDADVFYSFELISPRLPLTATTGASGAAALRQRGGVARGNLAPNAVYRVWAYRRRPVDVLYHPSVSDPERSFRLADVIGFVDLRTGPDGSFAKIPPIQLRALSNPHDRDQDGLSDPAEFVVGTDPENPDTDGDGILDGAELDNGTDPLGGAGVLGIIGSLETPGTAQDVCGANDVLVVADGPGGVTVINAFNTLSPVVIARVETPGEALRVACTGTTVAVADGTGGLAIVDISDPPAAAIRETVSPFMLAGRAECVAAVARSAYVGSNTGRVSLVDLESGAVLERVTLGTQPITDVVIAGGTLFATDTTRLYALSIVDPLGLRLLGSVGSPSIGGDPNQRLFVGGGVAYVAVGRGVNTFDVSDPQSPSLIQTGGATQVRGWGQLVVDGTGIGVAAVGATPSSRDVGIYDASDPSAVQTFITSYATPGSVQAVTLFNGLAYAVDGGALQVVRFLAPDTGQVAPSIALSSSGGLTSLEEGQLASVAAITSDDVQVRNVEFYIDDQRVAVDGGFPFEHTFVVPQLATQTQLRLRARVFDTGGNSTFSDEYVVQIVPDTTAPVVRATSPRSDAIQGRVTSIAVLVSEPLDPASLNETTLSLTALGPDRVFGSGDDAVVNGGSIEARVDVLGAFRMFAAPLPAGRYRAEATTGITDLHGNALAQARAWEFDVFDVMDDRDGDGLPDALELALGLDPDLVDSNGDGTPDGLEDADGDGLVNLAEVSFGSDALNVDSDADSIADGDEDEDTDGLSARNEFAAGSSPFDYDSDKDGFEDGEEFDRSASPADPTSVPIHTSLQTVSSRNDGAASLGVAVQALTVQSTAAPQATSGSVEGPVFTAENQVP